MLNQTEIIYLENITRVLFNKRAQFFYVNSLEPEVVYFTEEPIKRNFAGGLFFHTPLVHKMTLKTNIFVRLVEDILGLSGTYSICVNIGQFITLIQSTSEVDYIDFNSPNGVYWDNQTNQISELKEFCRSYQLYAPEPVELIDYSFTSRESYQWWFYFDGRYYSGYWLRGQTFPDYRAYQRRAKQKTILNLWGKEAENGRSRINVKTDSVDFELTTILKVTWAEVKTSYPEEAP